MPPLPPRTMTSRLRDSLASPLSRAMLWVVLVAIFVVLWQARRPVARDGTLPRRERARGGRVMR